MGKEPLAGEPFKLTMGSPVPAAAPEHRKHTSIRTLYSCYAPAVPHNAVDSEKVHTGSARVTAFGCDVSELLNQRAEEFARL